MVFLQEYSNPTEAVSTQQSERKLYSMLPLFCKIFNSLPPDLIAEKLPEAPSFALAVSKLFVTEVSFYRRSYCGEWDLLCILLA